MSQPYIGEIRMFGGNFAPSGWAFCNGQLMPISENDALFTLIGTTYGGDGQSTFGIPDLQGRFPLHQGQGPGPSQNYVLGEKAGVESVTLTSQQIPIHNHALLASQNIAQNVQPAASVTAQSTVVKLYISDTPGVALDSQMLSPVGGSQPHDNLQPFLGISFIISLFGVFPSQT